MLFLAHQLGHTVTALAGDTTAPILSLPTGAKAGSRKATGTVVTDEGNGTLYYLASTNSSESAATIKASGSSQAVTATGEQAVVFRGLVPETDYFAHYVHDDSSLNESNVVSSSPAFTTDKASTGAGHIFHPGKPEFFGKTISFEGTSFEAFVEPEEVEESSAGMQLEINRFQGVVDTLQVQMDSIDDEIKLFKERSDLIRVKMLEEETERARLFVADLLLQILHLRGIKRRRVEEEELLVILMLDN